MQADETGMEFTGNAGRWKLACSLPEMQADETGM